MVPEICGIKKKNINRSGYLQFKAKLDAILEIDRSARSIVQFHDGGNDSQSQAGSQPRALLHFCRKRRSGTQKMKL
jgi:hypothetical protein